ncbi:MAG: hypothetical protein AB7T38_02520 [Nitrospirales bacterium]
MASDPASIIAKCDLALESVSDSGIVRYTMPDGRSVEKSVDDVIKIRELNVRLLAQSGAGGGAGRAYATFGRPR